MSPRRFGCVVMISGLAAALASQGANAATYHCAYAGGDDDVPAGYQASPGEITLDPATLHSPNRARWHMSGSFADLLSGAATVARWTGPSVEIRDPLAPAALEVAFHFNTRTHAGSFEEDLHTDGRTLRAFFDADCKQVSVV